MNKLFIALILLVWIHTPCHARLVVYYDFENDFTAGTLADQSGNGINGDCHLYPAQCPTIVPGPDGSQAAHFSGSLCLLESDYFYVPIPNGNWVEGTVSVWLMFDPTDDPDHDPPDSTYRNQRMLDTKTFMVPYTWALNKWGEQTHVTYAAPITNAETILLSFPDNNVSNVWHNYRFTWNATTAKAYYDGVLVDTRDKSDIPYLVMNNYLGIGALTHGNIRDTVTKNCAVYYYNTLDYYQENGYPGYEDPYTLTYVMPNACFYNGAMDDLYIYDNYIDSGVTFPVGDLNLDSQVDIRDAIMALQMTCAISFPATVPATYLRDVNGNGRIGVEEAIFVLQFISGLRQ